MKDIKLIVTGGYGFIGSHFIKIALENKIKVLNLDKVTYAANLKIIKEFTNLPNLTNIIGDITDHKLMKEIFYDFKPDGLINFAAETHVDNSISNPENFIKTNIYGTYNLLELSTEYLKNNSVDNFRFVQISTDEVFGSLGPTGFFNEKSSLSPRNPYSATKASSDHLAFSWYNTFKLPVIVSNCSNNFGPFQNNEKLIPKTIYSIFNQYPIKVYGNGKNIRDWLYVKDHVLGILKLFKFGKVGERYCIGGGKELSNLELINCICEVADKELKLKVSSKNLLEFVKDRPGHDFRYSIDDRKIRSEIKFTNKTNFHKALSETIKWYIKSFSDKRN